MTDKCIDAMAETHDFSILKKQWQQRHPVDGQILEFMTEILICSKCGKVIDPWLTEKEQK
jgi:hypothetical protein